MRKEEQVLFGIYNFWSVQRNMHMPSNLTSAIRLLFYAVFMQPVLATPLPTHPIQPRHTALKHVHDIMISFAEARSLAQ